MIEKKKLIQKLDSIFSQYIRQRDLDRYGRAECFTCGRKDDWHNLQNGHYISRKVLSLRYNEINCNVQCHTCNNELGGNRVIYTEKLIDKYGANIINYLRLESNKIKKFTDNELNQLIEHYSRLINK